MTQDGSTLKCNIWIAQSPPPSQVRHCKWNSPKWIVIFIFSLWSVIFWWAFTTLPHNNPHQLANVVKRGDSNVSAVLFLFGSKIKANVNHCYKLFNTGQCCGLKLLSKRILWKKIYISYIGMLNVKVFRQWCLHLALDKKLVIWSINHDLWK